MTHSILTPAQPCANEIIDAVPMAELLSALGFPKIRHGRTCCLLHGGDNPTSLSVNVQKGVFHCFVCGEGGGKLRLVELVLNCDRRTALRYLADLAGIPLEDFTPEQKAEWKRRHAAARVEGDAFYFWLKDHIQAGRDYREILLRSYHGAKRYLLSHSPSETDLRWQFAASIMERYYERIEELDARIDYCENVANYPELLKLYRKRYRRAA